MTLHPFVLGVDIAKDWIDVCGQDERAVRRIETTPRALKSFARKAQGGLVVFEASGGYERPLMAALEAAGVAYARVNPRHAREYARATGRLAKTDRVDARVLADMGRKLDLAPTLPIARERRRLADLVARRDDLVAAIVAERNRLAQAGDAFVRSDIQTVLKTLIRRRETVDREIAAHVKDHPALAEAEARLKSAPGVGPAIAAGLLARLPELGRLDRREIASLAGLAPHANESGRRLGKRRIWGGRADVRRGLYLAAFIASRCDPAFKALRRRMTEAGKPLKVILIAIARRMLVALNAMIREERDFRPQPQ
jgi:transposase